MLITYFFFVFTSAIEKISYRRLVGLFMKSDVVVVNLPCISFKSR